MDDAMVHSVTVRHNFETAHRLPILGGKCMNLHGHSWWCHVTVAAPELTSGTVVEFGSFKAAIRSWIDDNLDHGSMLGSDDPLVSALTIAGSKVFRFGADDPSIAERFAAKLCWPTVENVAALLGTVAEDILVELDHAPHARVAKVQVSETHVNTASWEPHHILPSTMSPISAI